MKDAPAEPSGQTHPDIEAFEASAASASMSDLRSKMEAALRAVDHLEVGAEKVSQGHGAVILSDLRSRLQQIFDRRIQELFDEVACYAFPASTHDNLPMVMSDMDTIIQNASIHASTPKAEELRRKKIEVIEAEIRATISAYALLPWDAEASGNILLKAIKMLDREWLLLPNKNNLKRDLREAVGLKAEKAKEVWRQCTVFDCNDKGKMKTLYFAFNGIAEQLRAIQMQDKEIRDMVATTYRLF